MDSKPTRQSHDNFLVQGSILAIAGIIVRLIGLVYKVPMIRILGDEGIGYYNTAYEIYNIGLILSSYSLPLAVSKLIAARQIRKEYANSKRVFNCSLLFGLIAGGIMTLALILGSGWLTTYVFKSPGSALPLKVMAPTILVFSIMGVFRGFFQGHGNMVPTSVSQIIEQVINAIVSVAAAWYLMNRYAYTGHGASYGAAGGTLGTLSGACAAFLFLTVLIILWKRGHNNDHLLQKTPVEPYSAVVSALAITITPIIMSQFVYQLSGSVDNSLFGILMDARGIAEKERVSMLGIYSGKYRLLSNVPVAIASALGTSMIPSIVASRVQGRTDDVQDKISLTMKFNMMIAIPCSIGMGVLASPIMKLVFHDGRAITAQLMMLGFSSVVFFSLSTVTSAVLQGLDQMRKSVLDTTISLLIHIVFVYFILRFTNLGVYGLVIGNVTFALGVCVLDFRNIVLTTRKWPDMRTIFFLPLVSAMLMGGATWLVYHGIHALIHSNTLALFVAIPVAMAVYAFFVFRLHAVTENELLNMPFGRKLVKVYRKINR